MNESLMTFFQFQKMWYNELKKALCLDLSESEDYDFKQILVERLNCLRMHPDLKELSLSGDAAHFIFKRHETHLLCNLKLSKLCIKSQQFDWTRNCKSFQHNTMKFLKSQGGTLKHLAIQGYDSELLKVVMELPELKCLEIVVGNSTLTELVSQSTSIIYAKIISVYYTSSHREDLKDLLTLLPNLQAVHFSWLLPEELKTIAKISMNLATIYYSKREWTAKAIEVNEELKELAGIHDLNRNIQMKYVSSSFEFDA
jgi:hypothetical protein